MTACELQAKLCMPAIADSLSPRVFATPNKASSEVETKLRGFMQSLPCPSTPGLAEKVEHQAKLKLWKGCQVRLLRTASCTTGMQQRDCSRRCSGARWAKAYPTKRLTVDDYHMHSRCSMESNVNALRHDHAVVRNALQRV